MSFIEREGDLFEAPEKYLAHGCNAMGVMGAGVALQIKTRYPDAYRWYRKLCRDHHLNRAELLGVVNSVHCVDRVILNCITQLNFGTRYRETSYDAVAKCMENIAASFDGQVIAMPRIGTGLGGGSWSVIREIIRNASNGRFTAVVYTPAKKAK